MAAGLTRVVSKIHAVHSGHDTAIVVEGHFRPDFIGQKGQREPIRVVPVNQLKWATLLNSLTGPERVMRSKTFLDSIKFGQLHYIEDE